MRFCRAVFMQCGRDPLTNGTKRRCCRFHPPSPLPCRGLREGHNGRNVTANAAISSVGGLSGRRIYVEDVYPAVDAGRFAVKRIAGEAVEVWADIFRDGHALL